MTLEAELAAARRLAVEAGAILEEVRRAGFQVSFKGPKDPVTEADTRASAHIVAGLSAAFPDDGVVSEEAPAPEGAMPPRVWFVDPLDGTQQFVDGGDEYAVMIGLCVEGRPALGVVHQPRTGRSWTGLTAAPKRAPHRALEALAVSRNHRGAAHERIKAALGAGREVVSGSVGLKVGLLVDGKADAYVEPSRNTFAWDSCAPQAVLEAAGGVMTDLDGGPLRYDWRSLRNERGIAASAGAAHEDVVAALKRLGL